MLSWIDRLGTKGLYEVIELYLPFSKTKKVLIQGVLAKSFRLLFP